MRNVLVRGGYRLVPWWPRRAVYRPIVARHAEHLRAEQLEDELAATAPEPGDWDYAREWPDGALAAAQCWRELGARAGQP